MPTTDDRAHPVYVPTHYTVTPMLVGGLDTADFGGRLRKAPKTSLIELHLDSGVINIINAMHRCARAAGSSRAIFPSLQAMRQRRAQSYDSEQ